MTQPKTLLYDIETAPHIAAVWGMYETDVFHLIEPGYILCMSYKWLGEEKIHTISLRDFPGYTKGSAKEKSLVKAIWKLFDEADIVVAQNGDAFDAKELNARFIKYGLTPPSPYQSIDTYKMSKMVARLPSHKLDEKAKYYGYGGKLAHAGKKTWLGCMEGDKKSWKIMEEYNRHDVVLLEQDYRIFAPWVKLPNANLYTDGKTCPKPGCGGKVIRRGPGRNNASMYWRYQCKTCGGYCRGVNISMPKPEIQA